MGGRQRGSARDADQLVALAIQGGLPTDTTQLDPHFVHRNISRNTASEYERALELWEAFERRFPGSTPTDIQTLKQYAECIALAAKGRLDKTGKRRPTATSVRNEMRQFCSAWQRAHNARIPPDVRLSMAPYIEGELAKKLGLPTGKKAHKKKTFLTIENYVHMQERLWCNDYHHYVHEAYRLDNANLLNTHCFTSARLQEVCQAHYQMKAPDGLPPPLFAQPLLHWLANVISARASSELTTVEQALSLKPPKKGNFRIIEWDRHMIDRPVFPEWTRNGPTDKTRSPDSWSDEVSKWAKRAGLTNGTGLHAPRREALIKCNDRGYSLGQVLRFASQHNTHVLVNHYLGNMSTIDGAGTYLNMRPRTDLVEDFRSATMRWNPGLYLSLSAKDKEELEGSLEYKAVTRGINELSTRIREATTEDEKQQLKYQRRLEYDRRKAIENKRLREIQAAQKIIYDWGDDPHEQHDWRQIHFDRISHMLPPERLRLAKSMTLRAWPRSSEWVSVLKDLIALRENNDNAAYQEVMRPIQGYCAVPPCRKPMASVPKPKTSPLGNGYTECGFGYFEPLAEADADLLDFATLASPPPRRIVQLLRSQAQTCKKPEYPIECLLAMWKSQRSQLFLVKWVGGSTSWEPEMNVPDQSIAELKRTYRGFRDGIEILQTQVRGKALWYKILFLNFDGADEDRSWWVPEKAMDPEVRVKRETKNKRRRRKHS
ncbi:hypothetical protein ACCO45_012612 [Purpureocillium lilacinum]|uniref:Uncharacterized protein n=1 Tax=Purpureocillium lilacinum TaxID=33203 RepID=A0ACC4D8L7_PURLI